MESAEFIDRKKGASHEFISNDLWGEDPAPFLKNKQWRYVKCSDCDQAFHQFILAPEWNERRFSKWMTTGNRTSVSGMRGGG
jgi:hypothetical protein